MPKPSSPKRRIRQNRWDNWYGYLGTRRAVAFNQSATYTQKDAAELWLKGAWDPTCMFPTSAQ